MIRLVPATVDHAEALQLREEDLEELASLGITDPGATLRTALESSVSTHAAVAPDGTVVALFGVRLGDRIAAPWLLCSEAIERHSVSAVRIGLHFVSAWREVLAGRALLCNFIGKEHVQARRFIEHLGGHIEPCDGPADLFYL